LSSSESQSTSFSPGVVEPLKLDEEKTVQSRGLRRKISWKSESQSPDLTKKSNSRRLSDTRTISLPEKKGSTEELPDFFSSPISLPEMPFSEKVLRRTSASVNLAANIMEEPDSAASLSSNQDYESDMEKLCSPKSKVDLEMGKDDDSFCQFAVDL
jgi:hypothetical protein